MLLSPSWVSGSPGLRVSGSPWPPSLRADQPCRCTALSPLLPKRGSVLRLLSTLLFSNSQRAAVSDRSPLSAHSRHPPFPKPFSPCWPAAQHKERAQGLGSGLGLGWGWKKKKRTERSEPRARSQKLWAQPGKIQSHLVPVSFRVRQALHSSHFDQKKMSQRSVLPRDWSPLPEHVWVRHRPTRENASSYSTRGFRHSSQVPEQINSEDQGTTVLLDSGLHHLPYTRLLSTPHGTASHLNGHQSTQQAHGGAWALTKPHVRLQGSGCQPCPLLSESCRPCLVLSTRWPHFSQPKHPLRKLPCREGVCGHLCTPSSAPTGAAPLNPSTEGCVFGAGRDRAPSFCVQKAVRPFVSAVASDRTDRWVRIHFLCPSPSQRSPCVGPGRRTHHDHRAGRSQALSLCKGKSDSRAQLLRSQHHEPWLVRLSGLSAGLQTKGSLV